MPGRVELSVANFQLAQYPIAIVDSEISWLERGVMFVQELLYSVARPWMTQPFDKIEKPAVNRQGAPRSWWFSGGRYPGLRTVIC